MDWFWWFIGISAALGILFLLYCCFAINPNED
jgi:hypothetical protein